MDATQTIKFTREFLLEYIEHEITVAIPWITERVKRLPQCRLRVNLLSDLRYATTDLLSIRNVILEDESVDVQDVYLKRVYPVTQRIDRIDAQMFDIEFVNKLRALAEGKLRLVNG